MKTICNLILIGGLSLGTFAAQAQKKEKQFEGLSTPGSASLRPVKNAQEVKFDYKQMNAPLPKFEVYDHEQKNVTKTMLESGGNLFFMIFNPVCDHCEDQTALLLQNDSLFKKSKLLLAAAPVQVPNISFFEANVKFSEHQRMIMVSVDSAKVLDKLFLYQELPQINIYDGKSHRLLKTFSGLQPIDSLKPYIQ